MELKYVVLTIIKILISVPTIVNLVHGAALMGGHLDNKTINNSTMNRNNVTDSNSEVLPTEQANVTVFNSKSSESEDIPDPSPLVLPGYNLPENIFNKGKPFYLEKDPLTGQIDFDSKAPLRLDDDMYEYVDDEPSSDIYDKANIDRKDGSLSSHKPSDVNQLTPNFHDFLNLPVKYNSDKYVYPLISSSYANTKIQGNVNKYHNHKDYNDKTLAYYKPTGSPTYYSSTKNPNYNTYRTETSTTTKPTTSRSTTEMYSTSSKIPTLMNTGMNHPSFSQDFDDYDESGPQQHHSTTKKNIGTIYLTTKAPSTSTKRTMSLFEQLFGDYDESVTTTEKTKPPPHLQNLPGSKINKNEYESEMKTEKIPYETSSVQYPNAHAGPNVLTGSNMAMESLPAYEYEDEYEGPHDDNVAVEDKLINNYKTTVTQPTITTTISSKLNVSNNSKDDYVEYEEYDYPENKTATTSTTPPTSTTAIKVTSLPLGENHVTNLNNPIIVATQNLREKLNTEKVVPKPFGYDQPLQNKPPSNSNIHIAPDQDTVSFVVGHHQNVDGDPNGQYVGSSLKESPYDSNPFRPLYGQQAQYSPNSVGYTVQTSAAVVPPNFSPGSVPSLPAVGGSAVTIQPEKNSEASLAIGVPVDGVKQVPGQVVDEKLEMDGDKVKFPQGSGSKVVFPDDSTDRNQVGNLVPPPLQSSTPLKPPHLHHYHHHSQPQQHLTGNREVLKLNSKPMYHQLPSDLTPPKEKESVPSAPPPVRKDRPRPPWDPRPGHFHAGKPEYVRPPRPSPEQAYKRIDNLPNILPQFRPNTNNHGPAPPSHYSRQPLLDRPSNRPVGFFEKLQPPPPPKNLHNLRKIPQLPPPHQNLDHSRPLSAEDRISDDGPKNPPFNFYQSPPKVVLANRRIGNIGGDVETLQMIQAKKSDNSKKEIEVAAELVLPESLQNQYSVTDKPLYVVYPVNTPPINLDVISSNKKENVVIGTRAELPLPPSKINAQHFNYALKDRNDAPILKPHPRPSPSNHNTAIRTDFPYALERPDPAVLNPVPEASQNHLDETDFVSSSNQWNSVGADIESRIVSTGNKQINANNQISATLKTSSFTEKPIAVAYTPTEPHHNHHHYNHNLHHYKPEVDDKYSMPNYGSPVIPEIRPGTVDDAQIDLNRGKPDSEFTVSAVMHTHLQPDLSNFNTKNNNRKHYIEETPIVNHGNKEEFQAPFQASVSVDSASQGWSVVRDKNKSSTITESSSAEVTTMSLATAGEFDIENFKPQLESGFKPIYTFPEETRPTQIKDNKDGEVSESLE